MTRVMMAVLVLVGAALIVGVPVVHAHAEFVTSTPAPDSSLSSLPVQVSIVFTQTIMRSSTIVVIGPTGATVSGPTTVQDNTAATAVQPAGPGVYQVQWSNVSAEDGHEKSGSFQFTVVAAAPAARPPAGAQPGPPAAAPAPAPRVPRTGAGPAVGTALPALALVLALAMAGAATAALIAARRRRSRS